MQEWRDYIQLLKEKNTFLNRVKSYTSDRDELLNKGGQKNTPPYANKMSKHVTFDKQVDNLGEEVEPESFDINDTLEPRIWHNEEICQDIRGRLLKIASDFIDGLPVDVKVKDITLTGSLANYNWSNYSDFDLHIIVDFRDIDPNVTLVKSFFDNARMRWNDTHDIKIKGYEVEVYIEDSNESHKSSGLYSLMDDKWLIKPKRYQREIDFNSARRKADDIEFQVNIVSNLINVGRYKIALRNIDRLKDKIRNMRRAGLESKLQEFSVENIAFKILRRNDTLGLLSNLKVKAYDSLLAINGEDDGIY